MAQAHVFCLCCVIVGPSGFVFTGIFWLQGIRT